MDLGPGRSWGYRPGLDRSSGISNVQICTFITTIDDKKISYLRRVIENIFYGHKKVMQVNKKIKKDYLCFSCSYSSNAAIISSAICLHLFLISSFKEKI